MHPTTGGRLARSCFSKFSPAQSVPRESPTPVLFVSSPFHDAQRWLLAGVVDDVVRSGYTTALIDLPGCGGAQSLPRSWTLDHLITDLHHTISSTRTGGLPVVVAPSFTGPLFHHYLESYPLAALVLVNPFPPDTERFVQQKGVDPAAPESIAHWLRMCAEGENPKFLASHTDEATVDIARSIAEKFTSMDPTVDSEHCCGVEAVAAMSSLLARAPVRLEPSPVPLLVIHGAGDQMVDAETVRLTVDYHGLQGDNVALLDSTVGHEPLLGGDRAVAQLSSALLTWLRKRF